jgi:hypothetical protein
MSRVLAGDVSTLVAFLDESGLIKNENAIRISEVLDDISLQRTVSRARDLSLSCFTRLQTRRIDTVLTIRKTDVRNEVTLRRLSFVEQVSTASLQRVGLPKKQMP